eukprot:GEMP01045087.1.p1 GENE.GEMP01045087.1~~GEMP01045087.1.p1  ORF type:complete len:304 (+),score=57.02 GEMP01045087.1:347-1258(+)
MNFLDADNDGNVTLKEVEHAQREFADRVNRIYQPIKSLLIRNKPIVEMCLGYTSLCYGGHFSHLFLCCTSFNNTEWNQLKTNVADMCDIGHDAKDKFEREVGNVPLVRRTDEGQLHVSNRVVLGMLQSIDPARLTQCSTSLYRGLLVALCTAVDQNAAKLGLGVHLGDRISTLLWSCMQRVTRNVKIGSDDDTGDSLTWGKLALKTLCTTVSVWLSWRLKDACASWAACHWGGLKIAQGTLRLLRHDDEAVKEMLGLVLAAYGFGYQLRHFNRPPIPWFFTICLCPVFLIEAGLRTIALSGRP